MIWRREKLWRAVAGAVWALAALLFVAAVALVAFYWPKGPPPSPAAGPGAIGPATPADVGGGESDSELGPPPVAANADPATRWPRLAAKRSDSPGTTVSAPAAVIVPVESMAPPSPEAGKAPSAVRPPMPPATGSPKLAAKPDHGAMRSPRLAAKQEIDSAGSVSAVAPVLAPSPAAETVDLLALASPAPGSDAVRPRVPAATADLSDLLSPTQIYRNRFGQAKAKALDRFGGSKATAAAVADGLAWLAAHQDDDGKWDRVNFTRHCSPDRCENVALHRLDRNADVAVTALALLAFLGDGHRHTDPADLYYRTTSKAVEFLVGQQEGGLFGPDDLAREAKKPGVLPEDRKDTLMMYNQAIATLALAEAYGLTRDPKLVEPAMAGVEYLARSQQPEGGWDYWPDVTHRNDTSITGWAVAALRASMFAGVPTPVQAVYKSAGHFSRATEPDGGVWYADRNTGTGFERATGLPLFRYGPAMVAVGLHSRQLNGYRASSPAVIAAANRIFSELPDVAALHGGDPTGLHSEYYWYFGTMSMFQMGGRHWQRWNGAVQRAVLPLQDRSTLPDGRHAHRYGSWAAYGANWGNDSWGGQGGRVYSTALYVLMLEVFYRYLPLTEMPVDYDYSPVFDQYLNAEPLPPDQQLALVSWLGHLRPQLAEPILLRLLADAKVKAPLRIRAAVQLASFGNPLARRTLEANAEAPNLLDSMAGQQALGILGDVPVPDTFGPIRDVDPPHGLATFATGDAYLGYGLPLAVVDAAGRLVARMTLAAFDRNAHVAVARMLPADKAAWPAIQPGLTVRLDWK